MILRFPAGTAIAATVLFVFSGALGAQQAPREPAPPSGAEQQELQHAIQEAGPSVVDFVRALEAHLRKYPSSASKTQIERALFRAAKELKDNRRIALYGEHLLQGDPADRGVLEETGRALNSFDDPNLASHALEYGKRLEDLVKQNSDESLVSDGPRERGKRLFEKTHQLAAAYLIEADALGVKGDAAAAVELAKKSFDTFPAALAARSAARWLATAGKYDQAVEFLADAFALPDAPEVHNEDRKTMAAYYRKTHSDEKGLGDVVLAAYDRMTAIAGKQKELYGNSNSTKPIDFKLGTLDGKTFALGSLKGKVIVMDFWATWCGPCREQHPLFEKVKQQFRGDDRVAFLELNSDDDHSLVAPFLEQQKWSKDVLFEDGLSRVLDVKDIPTTVLLDRNGDVYSKMIGFNPSNFVALLTSRIEGALSGTSESPRPN
jgi:thiol-disulfide isomerase/thioredoxin